MHLSGCGIGTSCKCELGSGGGAGGRAMAFCPSRPGSNPGTDLAFLEECYQSILAGRWAIS